MFRVIFSIFWLWIIFYGLLGFFVNDIVKYVDSPEVRWSILDAESKEFKENLSRLCIEVKNEKRTYFNFGKKITLYLDSSFASTGENIESLKEVLDQIGYENIEIGKKYKDGSFGIYGTNEQKTVNVSCDSERVKSISIEITYTRSDALGWLIAEWLSD